MEGGMGWMVVGNVASKELYKDGINYKPK